MKIRLDWVGTSALLLASACATATDEGSDAAGLKESALTSATPAAPLESAQSVAAPETRSSRSSKDPEAKRHPTGRREMTPQELEHYNKTVPRVVGVRPTQLLVDRLREAQTQAQGGVKSLQAQDLAAVESEVVPFGSDIVIAQAGEANERVASSALAALPPSVDNSISPAFPEIRDQGELNSCVAFALGYYQYTYALGKLLGWNNKNSVNSTKVSPKWLYNLANGGGDYGSGGGDVQEILSKQGALTWSEFPYVGQLSNPLNYLAWPTTSSLWKSALRYQSSGYASVGNVADAEGFAQTKNLLANGQVLTFSTFIYSWEYEQVDNDPSTSADDALVGQHIATWQNGQEGGHQATLVGYNDDIWVDINANGVVESSEKGAFKIANSWGTGWKNAGYAWVAYDAVRAASAVPNGPSAGRTPLIGGITALVGAKTNYQPNLLAEFTVSTASRGDLRLAIQQVETDRTQIVDDYRPVMFRLYGGSYAFDGTETTQPKSATFALDLSTVALSYGDFRYRVHGENLGSINSSISNFSITDRLRSNQRTTTTDPTATIGPNQSKFQSIRYKFQDPSRVPQIAITPSATSIDFGSLTLGQSVQRQVTVQNTGTGDLGVSSLRFSNPLFLSRGPGSLRLAPGESRVVDLEFAPAASQSEQGTLSIRNTSTNQPNATFNLSGAATSTNDSAPYQVFITQQNGATDDSVAFRAEIKSRVATSTNLSDYQVVYYLSEPGLDPATLQWQTSQSNIGTVTASVRRVFLTRDLGPRRSDLALTFRFPAGATLAPGASAIFQGALRAVNSSWLPNEADDWSRFLRSGGMAEGTIIQQVSNLNVLFGLEGEKRAGAYQLQVSPNPATGLVNVTFVVTNPSETERSIGLYIMSPRGEVQLIIPTWIASVGMQTVELDVSWLSPGTYTALLQFANETLDAYNFTKQ